MTIEEAISELEKMGFDINITENPKLGIACVVTKKTPYETLVTVDISSITFHNNLWHVETLGVETFIHLKNTETLDEAVAMLYELYNPTFDPGYSDITVRE